jgi:hypothetical protein
VPPESASDEDLRKWVAVNAGRSTKKGRETEAWFGRMWGAHWDVMQVYGKREDDSQRRNHA